MNDLANTETVEGGQLAPNDNGAMSLLAQAVQNNAQPEQIDKLIELVKFHDQREALRAFNTAFTRAQAEFPPIRKVSKVDYRPKSGGRVQYEFAPFDHEVEQLRPILQKYGLSFRHEVTENDNDTITVRCILAHEAGHSESAGLTGPADKSGSKNGIQAIGSSVTYLKRYTFEAVTGIVTTRDDDGAAADGVERITEAQAADLEALVDECGFSHDSVKRHYKISAWGELPAANFDTVCREIRAKYKAKHGKEPSK